MKCVDTTLLYSRGINMGGNKDWKNKKFAPLFGKDYPETSGNFTIYTTIQHGINYTQPV